MKTIKQIADEIGCSKQAIQKRIAREPLYTSIQPYIHTQDGTKYIDVDGEKLVKSAFSKQGIDSLSIDVGIDKDIDKSDVYTPLVHTLQATLDTLQEQLQSKDEQIRALQAELQAKNEQIGMMQAESAKLLEIADHAQELQARSVLQIEQREPEPKRRHWWRRKPKE